MNSCVIVWCVRLSLCLGLGAFASLTLAQDPRPDAVPARTSIAVEALLRLEETNLESNPRLKDAVNRILAQVAGTPDFTRLVKKFNLPGQEEALLAIAGRLGSEEGGPEAMRLIIVGGKTDALERHLKGTNGPVVERLVQALGSAGDQRAVGFLKPLVQDSQRPVAVRRQAVKSLVRYQEGAAALLRAATEDRLAPDLKFSAGAELSSVRWPEIKSAAMKLFPPPESGGGEKLPSLAELVKRRGDAASGRTIFNGKATCATCHQVQGQGVNFGPELTQVGTKLGKDALYESILDPSAGISFGFESWLFTLKSGDEAFGLIASETETDVTIKAPGGVVTTYKKSEIEKRDRQALSVMPAGLQATMTVQELVDLVEYLASLKKP